MNVKRDLESIETMRETKDWCLFVLKFLDKSSPSPFFSQMMGVVEETYKRKDARGLKMLESDVAENARGLSIKDAKDLDNLLVAKFGWGLSAKSRQRRREVATILVRGVVETEEQYRVLSERADEIYADTSKASELEKINALLAKYVAPSSSDRKH